jgi:flagellar hook capping protein FlgD
MRPNSATRPKRSSLASVGFRRFAAVLRMLTGLSLLLLRLNARAQGVEPEIQISPADGVQNQPMIAANGSQVVAVCNDSRLGGCSAYSSDGGATWAYIGQLPGGAGYGCGGSFLTVCCDKLGNFYAADVTEPADYAVSVWRGRFVRGSFSWESPVVATPWLKSAGYVNPADVPHLSCDRERGFLYLCYTECSEVPYYYELVYTPFFVRSLDGGATWSQPIQLGSSVADGARATVGPDGEVYVVWEDFADQQIYLRNSMDFGATFSPPVSVAPVRDNLGQPPPAWLAHNCARNPLYFDLTGVAPNYPSVDVDCSHGPNRGRLYAAWTDYADGTVLPGTGYVVQQKPNGFFSNATPLTIGQSFDHYVPDVHNYEDNPAVFTFEAQAGTTLWIDTQVFWGYQHLGDPVRLTMPLYCGPDSTHLTRITRILASQLGAPPLIYTVPQTGRYWCVLPSGMSGEAELGVDVRQYQVGNSVARDDRDVVMVTSDDGGNTWSSKMRVNDDPPGVDDCFPEVAVDSLGQVHVAWYDRRDEAACGNRVNTYWRMSRDGGRTFQPSVRLSSVTSSWECGGNAANVGDYLGLTADGAHVFVSWAQLNCPQDVDVHAVRIDADQAVATLLSYFRGELKDGRPRLTWALGDERGIAGFVVERSAAYADDFIPVHEGTLPATGSPEYFFEDRAAVPGQRYAYRLRVLMENGQAVLSDLVLLGSPAGIEHLAWRAASPNPFSQRVSFTLAVPRTGPLQLGVYDIAGHEVTALHEGLVEQGEFHASWDGRDRTGHPVAAGVYLVHGHMGGESITRTIVRIR